MKKFNKIVGATIFFASVAFAGVASAATVNFIPEISGVQYFECTVSDPIATVQLDTHDVDAQGFCAGKGHLTTDSNTVNTNFFEVNSAGGQPSMTVNVSSGTITCKNMSGPDNSRSEYGQGQGFCALPSSDKK